MREKVFIASPSICRENLSLGCAALHQQDTNWHTKKQATAETTTYSSEFVAARTCIEQIIGVTDFGLLTYSFDQTDHGVFCENSTTTMGSLFQTDLPNIL